MAHVSPGEVPADSLLITFAEGSHPERWRHYVDCYAICVKRPVTLQEFVRAFYTSRLFKVERWLLALAAGAPSSDEQAHALADGRRDTFAVWRVGARTEDQLLMCDRYGKTRSWFAVQGNDTAGTILKFGSAVAGGSGPTGSPRMGWRFRALLGFHRLYSRLLLKAAARGCRGS
jgi:hypothetical protein